MSPVGSWLRRSWEKASASRSMTLKMEVNASGEVPARRVHECVKYSISPWIRAVANALTVSFWHTALAPPFRARIQIPYTVYLANYLICPQT